MLLYAKNDIERICGFKSKKFTMVNYLFTFILGVLIALAFYGALIPFYGKGITQIDMFFHGGPKERSSIPVFLATWRATSRRFWALGLR